MWTFCVDAKIKLCSIGHENIKEKRDLISGIDGNSVHSHRRIIISAIFFVEQSDCCLFFD